MDIHLIGHLHPWNGGNIRIVFWAFQSVLGQPRTCNYRLAERCSEGIDKERMRERREERRGRELK
jgi:hypothetical protein